jgi:hypothetical protein
MRLQAMQHSEPWLLEMRMRCARALKPYWLWAQLSGHAKLRTLVRKCMHSMRVQLRTY